MIYDSLIIGPVSLDENIDCEGNIVHSVGGAVVYSGFAAAQCGFNTAVITKSSKNSCNVEEVFKDCNLKLMWKPSEKTCAIRNQYFTADKEKRTCTSLDICDAFTEEDIFALEDNIAKIYHFAGLVYGDFDDELFKLASKKGKVAVDVQCLLRHVEKDRTIAFYDWERKLEYLPYIDYLKTDAAEAEILTGTNDRKIAAEMLHSWGAKEVIITHNTEVLAYDGEDYYTVPIKSRNLSGRTGRGDTTFAGYINSRLYDDIPTSLLFATALVSLKMETPGPFRGNRNDVKEYIRKFY